MPPIEIRPFRRSDRDQVTALVNAHIEAVLPGVSVSPNAVLAQLEREPGEYVVDPWVTARATLVAVSRERVVGAAHLLRYGSEGHVGPLYRSSGEIRWLLSWPGQNPAGAVEMARAADALVAAARAELRGVVRIHADGALPAPGVYGIPDRWPHVAAALRRGGFAPGDRVEVVLAVGVADLPRGGPPPLPELTMGTALGGHGVRFSAVLGGEVVGFHEVQTDLTVGGTLSRLSGWAQVWERWVRPDLRRRGIGTWLAGHAADRLRLARAERLLECVTVEDDSELPFLRRLGFTELTRTTRGWILEPGAAAKIDPTDTSASSAQH